MGYILASYLSALKISDGRIGLSITLTLLGDAVISLILTFCADKIGWRSVLILGSILMVASGVVFGLFDSYFVLQLSSV